MGDSGKESVMREADCVVVHPALGYVVLEVREAVLMALQAALL